LVEIHNQQNPENQQRSQPLIYKPCREWKAKLSKKGKPTRKRITGERVLVVDHEGSRKWASGKNGKADELTFSTREVEEGEGKAPSKRRRASEWGGGHGVAKNKL